MYIYIVYYSILIVLKIIEMLDLGPLGVQIYNINISGSRSIRDYSISLVHHFHMWTCFTCFLRLKLKDVKIRMVDRFEITIAHVLNWASAQTSQRNCFAGPFLNNSPRIALTCYSISTSIGVFLSSSLFYTTLYSNPPKHCENTQLIVPCRSKTTISFVLVTTNIPNIFPLYIYIIILYYIIYICIHYRYSQWIFPWHPYGFNVPRIIACWPWLLKGFHPLRPALWWWFHEDLMGLII